MADLDVAGGNAGGDSLRDMLSSAFDAQTTTPDTTPTTTPDSTSSTTPSAPNATTPDSAAPDQAQRRDAERSAADRARDEAGRFAKKPDAPTDPKAAAAAAAAAQGKVVPTAQPVVKAQEAPQHWAPQLRDAYRKLAPEAQGMVANVVRGIEGDYQRRVQAMQPYQDLATTAQQWGQYFAQLGTTPAQSFGNLLRAEYMLRNGLPAEKINMFRQLAQSYGVQLDAVAQSPQQQEYVDPQVQSLQQRIDEMARHQQALNHQMQQAQQVEQRRQQEAAQQPYVSMVEAFANEKAEDGSPRHPHFEQVADAMRGLLAVAREAGRNPSLGELYQQAVWSNPQTRAQMIASQAEAAKRKAEQEARARGAVTRKATASVTGSPMGASMPASAGTLRDELVRQMEAAGF